MRSIASWMALQGPNIDALASNDAKSMAKASSAMILENCNWMFQTVTAREK